MFFARFLSTGLRPWLSQTCLRHSIAKLPMGYACLRSKRPTTPASPRSPLHATSRPNNSLTHSRWTPSAEVVALLSMVSNRSAIVFKSFRSSGAPIYELRQLASTLSSLWRASSEARIKAVICRSSSPPTTRRSYAEEGTLPASTNNFTNSSPRNSFGACCRTFVRTGTKGLLPVCAPT